MNKLINLIGPVLKRVFHTNTFTTIGGLICLGAVLLLVLHFIKEETMVALLGTGGGIIGLGAKDGVRIDPVVAPEAVAAPDVPAAPAPPVVALLLLGLLSLTACASHLRPAPDVVSQLLPHQTALPLDSQQAPLPAYLVPPPAGLTPRQVRQFRRAQRQALIEAARTVPYKLGKGSAYAAPGSTAVATKKPDAPVAAGPGSSADDHTKQGQHANGGVVGSVGSDWTGSAGGATAPPRLTLLEQFAQGVGKSLPWLFGAGALWLCFVPLGPGGLLLPVLGRLFRRSTNNAA